MEQILYDLEDIKVFILEKFPCNIIIDIDNKYDEYFVRIDSKVFFTKEFQSFNKNELKEYINNRKGNIKVSSF